MRWLFAPIVLLPSLALAEDPSRTCDPATAAIDQSLRGPLFEKLKAAESEVAAAPLADLLWRDFTRAPDPHAQELLDRGMRLIRIGNPQNAVVVLDDLVGYCPDFAEGWNQRAFAHYLSGSFDAALSDIDRTLEIEPRHFGALSGKILTLMRQGRDQLALAVLQQALAVHPWMSERRLLPKGEKI